MLVHKYLSIYLSMMMGVWVSALKNSILNTSACCRMRRDARAGPVLCSANWLAAAGG